MNGRTLNGWKQIARYLDVSVRTAQRWERVAGLPVQRLRAGRGAVCGVPAELNAWFLGSHPNTGASMVSVPLAAATTSVPPVPQVSAAVPAEAPENDARAGLGRSTVRALELALIMLAR